MKWSIILNQISIFYEFLDVLAGPTYVRIINIKWIFDPKLVSSSAIALVIGGINA
jgi:hypothetical protein